jgi:hypothetical protein
VGVGGGTYACHSNCSVAGNDYVGGFAGSGNAMVDCYSTGIVGGQSYVGGFAGVACQSSHCYSTCTVGGHIAVGGFSADGSQNIGCFWDTEISWATWSDDGTGQSTARMQSLQTYLDAGWDFVGEDENGTEDIWIMPADPLGYPRLAWE